MNSCRWSCSKKSDLDVYSLSSQYSLLMGSTTMTHFIWKTSESLKHRSSILQKPVRHGHKKLEILVKASRSTSNMQTYHAQYYKLQ